MKEDLVPVMRRWSINHAVFAAAFASTGCEGTDALSAKNCLPLKVPAQVVLVDEAGLYTSPNEALPFLAAHPRNGVNDNIQKVKQVGVMRPGTRLSIRELTQRWGFDSGKGRISAIGTTQDGQKFEYAWGAGTQIGRAPWEPRSTPNLRTVTCDD